MKVFTILLILIPALISPVFAQEFQVNVVRKGGNLYLAEENFFIQTQYCFEEIETSAALLHMDGDSGDITFTPSGGKCTVKMLYGQTQLDAGKYVIKVSREAENWYTIVDKDMALQTRGCLSLVEGMDAALQMNEDGSGTLSLPDADEECAVEGIYSKGKLQKK